MGCPQENVVEHYEIISVCFVLGHPVLVCEIAILQNDFFLKGPLLPHWMFPEVRYQSYNQNKPDFRENFNTMPMYDAESLQTIPIYGHMLPLPKPKPTPPPTKRPLDYVKKIKVEPWMGNPCINKMYYVYCQLHPHPLKWWGKHFE